MYARITDRLRGEPATYLTSTDDESDAYNYSTALPRKKPKGTSDILRTADTKVVNLITWPHEMIYTHTGQEAVYEELSSMAFVNGYLCAMAMEMEQVMVRMLHDLQEMMEDGEAYG